MTFLFVLGAITVIVLAYFMAKEFSHIAEEKGYPEKKYFWWTFLLGAVGILMVIALPDRGKAYIADTKARPVAPEVQQNKFSSEELPDI